MNRRKGFGMIKFLALLVVISVLGGLGAATYYSWQKADMSDVAGRDGIMKGQAAVGYVDIKQKVTNALNANKEVTITEAEINQYIAKNLDMEQGGFLKGFASVQGVFVDLKPDVMEIFIEREIAQYGDDDVVKTDVFQPFNQTVSMKLKVYNSKDDKGRPTIKVEFPGGSMGKAPLFGMLVKIVKPSFDQIYDHFDAELQLGYHKMNKIMITDNEITLDPRATTVEAVN